MYRTAAPSSRIKKSGSRRFSSPFSAGKRRKPISSTQRTTKRLSSLATDHEALTPDRTGTTVPTSALRMRLTPDLESTSVQAIVEHLPSTMFTPIPERAAGMNSTKIAEVLNFRSNLPPLVSVSLLHALRGAPTSTDREVASLVKSGVLKKIVIPRRGTGASAVGDGLVLVSEWINVVRSIEEVSTALAERYIARLNGLSDASPFSSGDVKVLSKAGFLTASSKIPSVSSTFLRPGATSLGSLRHVANAGSSHASGSEGAVAASSVDHIAGGAGAASRQSYIGSNQRSYSFSLPNIGPYLRLLTSAQTHLLYLLEKSGPHKSLPLENLKEKWDGNVIDPDVAPHQRRGVWAGRTKKWREFYGLRFEWILAECIGSGLVECFSTGSVGFGVRAL